MRQPLITNIQKYSIHDGEGIRTTAFFKGCPLSCVWCHNPETQSFEEEFLWNEEACTGCGECQKACEQHAITLRWERLGQGCFEKTADVWKAVTDRKACTHCQNCTDYCLANAREFCGKTMSEEELYTELIKDRVFYEQSHGGVTLSGGEVLAQNMEYVTKLMRRLAADGIRVNIDTCGHVPREHLKQVLPYTDCFLYDIKLMDSESHKAWTGVGNETILENLIWLSNQRARIWIRVPVIGGVNADEEHMRQMMEFLRRNQICAEQIHLLPYHNTGSSKYARLDLQYGGELFTVPSREQMEELANLCRRDSKISVVFMDS